VNTVLLRSFVEVARLESYTRAAAALGLSQPAVYQHVLGLQGSLDVALVEMRGKRVVLTAAGKSLLPRVLRILEAEAELFDSVPARDGALRSTVIDLLSGFTIGQSLLPAAVARLKLAHPGVQIRCRTMRYSRELDDALLNYGYDAAIHSGRHIPPGLKRTDLIRDEVVLVRRADSAGEGRLNVSATLLDEGLVGYGAPSELKSSIENWIGQQPSPVRINVEFDTQHAILCAVLAGFGAGAINYSLCRRYVEDGSLIAVRLEPAVVKHYGLVYRAKATLGPTLLQLIDIMRSTPAFEPNLDRSRHGTGTARGEHALR
jgi:DNA-binding transcriptional LysR family regulator